MKYKINEFVFVKFEDDYSERLFKIIKYARVRYTDVSDDIHEKYVCVNSTGTSYITDDMVLGTYDEWMKYRLDSMDEKYKSEYIDGCEYLKFNIELRTDSFLFNMFKECY